MITEYIEKLREKSDEISSVWLFGSRANDTSTEKSDWDLMVFANENSLEKLKNSPELKNEVIDVLVVYDDENFIEPWHESGKRYKSGNLVSWSWEQVTESEAIYTANKYLSEDNWFKEGQFKSITLNALKVWPK